MIPLNNSTTLKVSREEKDLLNINIGPFLFKGPVHFKPTVNSLMEILFGFDCVKAALSSNRRQIYKLVLYEPKQRFNELGSVSKVTEILQLAQRRALPVQFMTRKELDQLTENRPHQNVALSVSKYQPAVLDSPQSIPKLHEYESEYQNKLLLLLVNLLDPQNVGSIIRSAAYFGCYGIISTLKDSSDFTPIVSKASAGCMEIYENIFRTRSAFQFIKNSKNLGYKIVGTGLSHSQANHINASDLKPATEPTILLLGNEGIGLSDQIMKLCDFNLKISAGKNSKNQNLDSLNVSVATGIILDRLLSRDF